MALETGAIGIVRRYSSCRVLSPLEVTDGDLAFATEGPPHRSVWFDDARSNEKAVSGGMGVDVSHSVIKPNLFDAVRQKLQLS